MEAVRAGGGSGATGLRLKEARDCLTFQGSCDFDFGFGGWKDGGALSDRQT